MLFRSRTNFAYCCHLLNCVFLLVIPGLSGSVCYGQHEFSSVAEIRTRAGIGTCFAVALSDTDVEVWTAGHCVEGVGTTATIVWSSGERTSAVVAWRNSKEGNDCAKLVGRRPNESISLVPVATGLPNNYVRGYHAGYGFRSVQTARSLQADQSRFVGRISAKPTAIEGDSGGPVLDSDGNCVGVVVQRTNEPNPYDRKLLAQPIKAWLPD